MAVKKTRKIIDSPALDRLIEAHLNRDNMRQQVGDLDAGELEQYKNNYKEFLSRVAEMESSGNFTETAINTSKGADGVPSTAKGAFQFVDMAVEPAINRLLKYLPEEDLAELDPDNPNWVQDLIESKDMRTLDPELQALLAAGDLLEKSVANEEGEVVSGYGDNLNLGIMQGDLTAYDKMYRLGHHTWEPDKAKTKAYLDVGKRSGRVMAADTQAVTKTPTISLVSDRTTSTALAPVVDVPGVTDEPRRPYDPPASSIYDDLVGKGVPLEELSPQERRNRLDEENAALRDKERYEADRIGVAPLTGPRNIFKDLLGALPEGGGAPGMGVEAPFTGDYGELLRIAGGAGQTALGALPEGGGAPGMGVEAPFTGNFGELLRRAGGVGKAVLGALPQGGGAPGMGVEAPFTGDFGELLRIAGGVGQTALGALPQGGGAPGMGMEPALQPGGTAPEVTPEVTQFPEMSEEDYHYLVRRPKQQRDFLASQYAQRQELGPGGIPPSDYPEASARDEYFLSGGALKPHYGYPAVSRQKLGLGGIPPYEYPEASPRDEYFLSGGALKPHYGYPAVSRQELGPGGIPPSDYPEASPRDEYFLSGGALKPHYGYPAVSRQELGPGGMSPRPPSDYPEASPRDEYFLRGGALKPHYGYPAVSRQELGPGGMSPRPPSDYPEASPRDEYFLRGGALKPHYGYPAVSRQELGPGGMSPKEPLPMASDADKAFLRGDALQFEEPVVEEPVIVPPAMRRVPRRGLPDELRSAGRGFNFGRGMSNSDLLRAYLADMSSYGKYRGGIVSKYAMGGPVVDPRGIAALGRKGDSELVHMTPNEVASLQNIATANGVSLTVNPLTGLPEAGILDSILPAVGGFALTSMGVPPWLAAMAVGLGTKAATGDWRRGISAGLGSLGGSSMAGGMSAAGTTTAAGAQAALGTAGYESARIAATEAAKTAAVNLTGEAAKQAARKAFSESMNTAVKKALAKQTLQGNILGKLKIPTWEGIKSNLKLTGEGLKNVTGLGATTPVTGIPTSADRTAQIAAQLPSGPPGVLPDYYSDLGKPTTTIKTYADEHGVGRGLLERKVPVPGLDAEAQLDALKMDTRLGQIGSSKILKSSLGDLPDIPRSTFTGATYPDLPKDLAEKFSKFEKQKIVDALNVGGGDPTGSTQKILSTGDWKTLTRRNEALLGAPLPSLETGKSFLTAAPRSAPPVYSGLSGLEAYNFPATSKWRRGGMGLATSAIPLAVSAFTAPPETMDIQGGGGRGGEYPKEAPYGYRMPERTTMFSRSPFDTAEGMYFAPNPYPGVVGYEPYIPARGGGLVDLVPYQEGGDVEATGAMPSYQGTMPSYEGTMPSYQGSFSGYGAAPATSSGLGSLGETDYFPQDRAAQAKQDATNQFHKNWMLRDSTDYFQHFSPWTGDPNPAGTARMGQFDYGMPYYETKVRMAGGGLTKGPGDGMSDEIMTSIAGQQAAALSPGEFIVPADVVSGMGNGDTSAGAKRLYAMMDRVRTARTGGTVQPPAINARKMMPV